MAERFATRARSPAPARGAPWPPDGHSGTYPWFVFALTLLAYFWRFGYGYGSGDQDEILPYLLHLRHPDLLVNDWFVQETQATQFSVRTYFVFALYGLSHLMPVWLTVLATYLVLWLLLCRSVYLLALDLTADRMAAAASVFFGLAVFYRWTLGGNDLVYGMLVPEMLGWALALPALRLFLQRRFFPAGALLGLATWFQLLVGLLTAGALGLVLLFQERQRRDLLPAVLAFGGAFLLFSLPASVPTALQQLSARTALEGPSAYYILGLFRAPHHYIFSLFGAGAYVRFGLLAVGGLVSWWTLRHRLPHAGFVMRFWVITGVFCVLGIVFTELIPVPLVLKLQVYKLTVLAKLLMVILCCAWIRTLLPVPVIQAARTLLARQGMGLALAGLLAAVTLWMGLHGVGRPGAKLYPVLHQRSGLGQVEAWARQHTPVEAVFAVPPSVSSFRWQAQRAIVVNYGAVPFVEDALQEWYRRLLDVAPIPPPEHGLGLIPVLDAAYAQQSPAAAERLAARYGMDYVVRSAPFPEGHGIAEPVFTAEGWTVYRVRRGGP